jgi:Rrf2 family protein
VLTKKGKYGLKAMAHLAQFPPGQLVGVLEIAEAQNIPKKFLDAILAELRNAGFIFSKKGKGGGYTLALPADDIAVGDIIRAINGPLAPIPCASKTRYQPCDDCPDEATCAVKLIMQKAQQELSRVLDGCSLSQMRSLPDTNVREKPSNPAPRVQRRGHDETAVQVSDHRPKNRRGRAQLEGGRGRALS